MIHVRGDTPSPRNQPYMTQPVLPGRVSRIYRDAKQQKHMKQFEQIYGKKKTNKQTNKQAIYYLGFNSVQ